MLIRTLVLKFLVRNKFHNFTSSVHFSTKKYTTHTTGMSSLVAYFRCKPEEPQYDFSFYLECKNIGVSRNFNFKRQITESIGEFQHRVRTNLDKTLNKKKKKKASTEQPEPELLEILFLKNNENINPEAICKDVMLQGGVVMKLLGLEYDIKVNNPWIVLLTLPDSVLAGFPMYPNKLDVEFADKTDCQYTWYKSCADSASEVKKQGVLANVTWLQVGNHQFFYTPSADDIGCYIKLKCVPVRGEVIGCATEVVSRSAVEAGPGQCPFETRHAFTNDWLPPNSFRVVTYNLLADMYADSDFSRQELFPYCPPYALAIDYRKQLFLKEIIGYHGDIVCLQEVDTKVFDLDLVPVLGTLGYQGIYYKKGGQVTEGLACFFQTKKFQLLASESITLGEEISTNPIFEHLKTAIHNNEALKARILDRGTILQVVVLQHVASQAVLVIGITHLYFHPDADHVRLLQSAACLCYLQHTIDTWKQKVSAKVSLLFCGDFNSTPEFGVYELMTNKHIPQDYRDWSSNEEEAVKGLSLSHDMHIESACGTPKYTNFTVGFADCLDYIFYQTDHLKVTQVIPFPSDEELKEHKAIPSVVFPSDHIALAADFTWSS